MVKTPATKATAATDVRTNKRPERADTVTKDPKGRAGCEQHDVVTPELRQQRVAEAAYLRAECRGFAPGCELDDWLAAELEVDALLEVECQPAEAHESD